MELLLKAEIVKIINEIQRGSAPKLIFNDIAPVSYETSEHKFGLVDSKNDNPIIDFDNGIAHYVNGLVCDTYCLKIICYDAFLHQFTFNDGKGNAYVNRLKDGTKLSDFLIYEKSESKILFIVHEVSNEDSAKKTRVAKKQLSDTLNQLYKSEQIGAFIDEFQQKLCYISAKDSRHIVSPSGMADGFLEIYKVLPEPIMFNWGQIGTHKFKAFETSYIQLLK